MTTLVWFRDDLRVADNPALFHACEEGAVVGVFLVADTQWTAHHVGAARRAFLFATLDEFKQTLAARNIPLLIVNADGFRDAPHELVRLAKQVSASKLAFNEQLPLNERNRDAQLVAACDANGIGVQQHRGSTLMPPGSVLTNSGTPYTVFSAFKRRWLAKADPGAWQPLPAPKPQQPIALKHPAVTLAAEGSGATAAGEAVAKKRLQQFVGNKIDGYHEARDLLANDGTSRLSAHLSVGSISARQCLHAAMRRQARAGRNPGIDSWANELIWRDFYRHIVALFPHISRGEAFRRETDGVPWRSCESELAAWKAGHTGYPLVDAAMRQLNQTGWMHNRGRMVSAMFLSKHLLIDWRLGERYFMEQLTDGDFAANNGGWQWSASTGTDAAPYFRIFNPTTQGKRFDAQATFVKRHVPELAALSPAQIFSEPSRHASGYPPPLVDHAFARQRALSAFKGLKN